jgi:hypothetical protein
MGSNFIFPVDGHFVARKPNKEVQEKAVTDLYITYYKKPPSAPDMMVVYWVYRTMILAIAS